MEFNKHQTNPMKRGYCRVSRIEQNLDRQEDALKVAGCDLIYSEKQSGNNSKLRPEFERLLREAQPGDTIIVQKLDRFGRSMIHLLTTLELLKKRGIEFKSLTDNFDTSSANGRLMLHMLAAFSQFEREMISDRVKDSLRVLKKNGIILGRPVGSGVSLSQVKELQVKGKTQAEIMTTLGIKKSRYYELSGKANGKLILEKKQQTI